MMDGWREALEKVRFSLRKKELDRDLDAELAAHLDLATSTRLPAAARSPTRDPAPSG